MKKFYWLFVISLAVLLSGCSLLNKSYKPVSPTKLVHFNSTLKVTRVWRNFYADGVDHEYLRLAPALGGGKIYTASFNGLLAATKLHNGHNAWQVDTKVRLTGGVVAADGMLFLGTGNGQLLALSQKNGSLVWWAPINSEVLSTPCVAKNIVLIKTESGELNAYDAHNGKRLWTYTNQEPNLVLRGSSSPRVVGNYVVAGFASGQMVVLTLRSGRVVWHRSIASGHGSTDVQRMVDIDVTPHIMNGVIYTVTYQGKIAALSLRSGRVLWQHKMSSYSGMDVDNNSVYLTDDNGSVWDFSTKTGEVVWKQNALMHRGLTGPAIVGDYVVVGDSHGYLHFMAKNDGHFVARVHTALFGGITTTPIVDNHNLYVYTDSGRLIKYLI